MIRLTIYKHNNANLLLPNVCDEETGQPISDANATVTFFTPDDRPVPDYANLQMLELADKPGWYAYPIQKTFDLPVGRYYVIFALTKGEDGFEQRQDIEVKYR